MSFSSLSIRSDCQISHPPYPLDIHPPTHIDPHTTDNAFIQRTTLPYENTHCTYTHTQHHGQILSAHILIRARMGQCHLRLLAEIPKPIRIPCHRVRCPGQICRPCHWSPPHHPPHSQARCPASLGTICKLPTLPLMEGRTEAPHTKCKLRSKKGARLTCSGPFSFLSHS